MCKALTFHKNGRKHFVNIKAWGQISSYCKRPILLILLTHISLTNLWQSYCTTHSTKSRGVAIFIKNSVLFYVEHTYKDPNSRFIILQGKIQGRATTIASIYAPNEAQATFFQQFVTILDRYLSPHLIVGGDFNLAAHPSLDRSRITPSSKAFPKSLTSSLSSLQLIDARRAHNIGCRSYTFYWNPHDSYCMLA